MSLQERRLRHRCSPPFPHPPDTVTQRLDRTPGTVFSTGAIWLVYFPFRSFGEAALYGRGPTDIQVRRNVAKRFDVFDSVIDRRYESPPSSSFSTIAQGLIRLG